MYEIYLLCSLWGVTCPRRNTYTKVTQTALFSVFQIKFYFALFSLTSAYPVFLIIFESVIFTLWDLSFSLWLVWRVRSSGIWSRVVSMRVTVSEEPSALICRTIYSTHSIEGKYYTTLSLTEYQIAQLFNLSTLIIFRWEYKFLSLILYSFIHRSSSFLRRLSGKFPAILNISRTDRMALM